jgi:DNA polymerase III gamma/tau subunit
MTFEDARTWIEETGLCLFLPKRQITTSVAPTFVEAIAGEHDITPDAKLIALAEELLVRLEQDGVVVRLNLLGIPGEQADYVVATWVLPYVYALRGDRDWRRIPQLTGSRQVSPLAVQTYKLIDANGDATASALARDLGNGVTESAVLRAIAELWQQLRIIPIVSSPGKAAEWQLLKHSHQKAIAEGASTSQVTAISVLASIYLQAVIAATMEDVEMFLSTLTARSKVREVLRGLVATRQVHTISLGHAPHFYVAGTLPEFSTSPTMYASTSAGSNFFFEREEEHIAPVYHPVIPVTSPILRPTIRPVEATPAAPVAETAVEVKAEVKAEAKPEVKVEARPEAVKTEAKAEVKAEAKVEAPKPAPERAHTVRTAAHTRPSKPAASSHGAKRPASAATHARPASSHRSFPSAKPAAKRTGSSHAPAHAKPASKPTSHAAKPVSAHAKSSAPKPKFSAKPAAKPASKPAHKSSSARPAARPASRKPVVAKSGGAKRPVAARPVAKKHK